MHLSVGGAEGRPFFYDANRDLMRNFNWFYNCILCATEFMIYAAAASFLHALTMNGCYYCGKRDKLLL